MIGHINLEMKQAGKPSAGNPHAGFDVARAENRLTVWLVRHSQRKRGAMDRPDLRGNWRQSSTLLAGTAFYSPSVKTSIHSKHLSSFLGSTTKAPPDALPAGTLSGPTQENPSVSELTCRNT